MIFNKKITALLLTGALSTCIVVGATGCGNSDSAISDLQDKVDSYEQSFEELNNKIDNYEQSFEELNSKIDGYEQILQGINDLLKPDESSEPEYTAPVEYAAECYAKLKYIDTVLSDRDCVAGKNFKLAQKWIAWTLIQAGYAEDEIVYQDVTFTPRGSANAVTTPNIAVTKKGKSNKQIIVGAHYDGDGTGDNGSGVSLALTTAEKIFDMDLEYSITFVFFTAEEYGCYGSTAYANAMTEEEIANTLYMINLDSLVCGDYAYIYGGVQDNANKKVTKTEAYDNAMAVSKTLGLSLKSNPWTWDNHAPNEVNKEFPSYASPSTGNWSDHRGFKAKGIPYVYFEATNWEIPDYTGYGETYLVGMLMNTSNDYLEYIEKYFPGRIMQHFTTFSTLLYALVTQTNVNF